MEYFKSSKVTFTSVKDVNGSCLHNLSSVGFIINT